jgi:pimeloyl-ACP methyl ester carboxylesterase
MIRRVSPPLAGLFVALTAIHATPACAQQAASAAAIGPTQMEHISVQVTGTGSLVMLIPGLSSPRDVYAGVVPALARHHRVYVVQVNGFAGDAPRANLRPGLLAGIVSDLHQFVTAHKIAAAPVVGHSMGGLVALMLAKAHPADVGKLLIVDALPFVGEIFAPGATVAAVEPQARAMRDMMAAAYGKPADPAMTAAIASRNALKPASQAQVAAWAARADPRVSALALYEDMVTDLRPDMAAIRQPITVLVPYSTALPQAQAHALYERAYAAAPAHSIVDVTDSGHFVMLDQPQAFATSLDAFLAG